MARYFDFDDYVLVPGECVLESRAHADVSAKLGPMTFRIPLMASNMPSIINEELAIELAKRNYFYVMHRFDIDILKFAKKMKSLNLYVSISVGIREEFYKLVDDLLNENIIPEYITIDIAHGHSKTVKAMIERIRSNFGDKTFIIAGNVGTPEGLLDLEAWGADAVKVGIGPGRVCSTTLKTGFGTRGYQLSAVRECAKVAKKVVVADGGCRNNGDIAKAISVGADWINSGYFFCGHLESPGETVVVNGKTYKNYYGNASSMQKKGAGRVEGISTLVPAEGSLFDRLIEIEEDLQSSVSYAGGTKLEDIRKAKHIILK